jgi:hypothetical protein
VKDELEEDQICWIEEIIKKRFEDKMGLMPVDDKFN